jgi:FkbM family methyltransferase
MNGIVYSEANNHWWTSLMVRQPGTPTDDERPSVIGTSDSRVRGTSENGRPSPRSSEWVVPGSQTATVDPPPGIMGPLGSATVLGVEGSPGRSQLRSRLSSSLPDPLFYRAVAFWFATQKEQRLLFLNELVPRGGRSLDVGAWWGPWTYWLSRRSDQVVSFEPNPAAAAFLRRVAGSNVRIEEVALSNETKDATLHVSPVRGRDALATLEGFRGEPGEREVAVHTVELDSYEFDDVKFVKIDVEGHESAMIAGAEDTLRRLHPTILIEIEQALNDEPISGLFGRIESLGYSGWFRRSKQWAPLSTFDVDRDQLALVDTPTSVSYINNFVFVPAGSKPGTAR